MLMYKQKLRHSYIVCLSPPININTCVLTDHQIADAAITTTCKTDNNIDI